jgi:hypothetical protein
MSKHNHAQIEMIKSLPASVRRKMNLTDLKVLTGAVLIQDRIAQHFVLSARSEAHLTKFKREHGYCGGQAACMTYTGDGHTCGGCLKAQNNPRRRKNKRSEYGLLSKRRKDAERAAQRVGR